jgi:hypothetical protein
MQLESRPLCVARCDRGPLRPDLLRPVCANIIATAVVERPAAIAAAAAIEPPATWGQLRFRNAGTLWLRFQSVQQGFCIDCLRNEQHGCALQPGLHQHCQFRIQDFPWLVLQRDVCRWGKTNIFPFSDFLFSDFFV